MSHFTLRRPRHPGRLLFLLFLAFLIYLIAGAVLPFSQYATVSEATRSSVSAEDFRQDSPGSDRVMLLETNESALLERIRLLNQAKELSKARGMFAPGFFYLRRSIHYDYGF